jgi:hypothetical protein
MPIVHLPAHLPTTNKCVARLCKLVGSFYADSWEEEFELEDDPQTTYSYRDALEKFVLSGGEWPEPFSPTIRPKGKDLLPKISYDYMELDDPARNYEQDGYDIL